MSAAIDVRGLSYRYRRTWAAPSWAVRDLAFEVPEGAVYGFLGPNGSARARRSACSWGCNGAGRGTSGSWAWIRPRIPWGSSAPWATWRHDYYPWMRVRDLLSFVAHYRPEWDAGHAEHLRRELGLELEPRVAELSLGHRAVLDAGVGVGDRRVGRWHLRAHGTAADQARVSPDSNPSTKRTRA